jgi:hypothetical protein
MLWLQGFEQAPKVVKECYRSWKVRNPNWEIRFLDADNYSQYTQLEPPLDLSRPDLSRPHLADIVRIKLLAEHGGVWCDATCFCNRPLDDWIDDATVGGFFCYLGHRIDTPMSNWFMASRKGSYISQRLLNRTLSFWQENHYPAKKRYHFYSLLKFFLNRHPRTPKLWFSYPVRKWFRVMPYFWFQYMFGILCREDPKFAVLWAKAPQLDAEGPHLIQRVGILEPLSDKVRHAVASPTEYLYKLNWKLHKFKDGCDGNNYPEGSNLDFVLRSIDSSNAPHK